MSWEKEGEEMSKDKHYDDDNLKFEIIWRKMKQLLIAILFEYLILFVSCGFYMICNIFVLLFFLILSIFLIVLLSSFFIAISNYSSITSCFPNFPSIINSIIHHRDRVVAKLHLLFLELEFSWKYSHKYSLAHWIGN